MPIDFHSDQNQTTYTKRNADDSWKQAVEQWINVNGKKAADIGCGGGIYSRVLAQMGAKEVIGVDFSEPILEGAKDSCREFHTIHFVKGTALATGLPASSFDLVLGRAVIHHLSEIELCPAFQEAFRLLESGGTILIQDRTPEDYDQTYWQIHLA